MDYYHILAVHSVGKSEKICYVCDLEFDSLMNDYVAPYISGETVIIDGYQINKTYTSKFKICLTNKRMADVVRAIRDSYTSSGIVALGINEETVLNNTKYSKDVTIDLFKKAKENASFTDKLANHIKKSNNSTNVFIVHGHDTSRLEAIENFVRMIGFNPIVLFKEADDGKTIIEKIESFSDNVCYCLVLYTKCDIGYPADDDNLKKPRARQNVVFEHGYMIGHLGRKNVSAILEDNSIEIPGDINGVVYVPMDDGGLWKYRIAKNMKSVGLNIDMNAIF